MYDRGGPTSARGGAPPGETEAREKGEWAGKSDEGVVPAQLGGSDAPREMLEEDPELDSSVVGRTTDSDEPATESGVDLTAGDNADAATDGGPDLPEDAEPDVKDIKTVEDLALYAHGTGALPPGVEGGLDAQTVCRD